MNDNKAYTRRQFLHAGMAVVSTATTVPGFLATSGNLLAAEHAAAATSSLPGVPEDRVLVVIQLSGGNDGLNTLIPYGNDSYYKARPEIAVKKANILTLDDTAGFGLHPNMAGIHEMIGDGLGAVIPGVGYPNPNRSHFASMDVWHSGDTRGGRGLGWIGKALDEHVTTNKNKQDSTDQALSCVSIGSAAPPAANGRIVKPVTFENAELFRWSGRDLHKTLDQTYDQIQRQTTAGDTSNLDFVFRTSMDAQIASDRVRAAVGNKTETQFPRTSLGLQLQSVASMIRDGLPTRVYYVAMGGFDTHANQTGRHQQLLRDFSQATSAFYKDLQVTGNRSRVVTLAFSEFGRRVRQNASGGTDHGTAGTMFLFGENNIIAPGLHGQYPSLTDLDDGDLKYNLDFRRVYADLLRNWMHMNPVASLGSEFETTSLIKQT
ncbi:DUF1501 domain-containing protein [Poriferisphaera sp. WC338]|uniref:DUF1501 domain-containing protein n=1 Tax=Poriferisphaera sp. WC338 TaxID=3425129 RepID=UPI003D818CC5